MPKAILEFNLPEEQTEFKTACQATDLKLVIYDFDNHLRSLYKYADAGMTDEEHKLLEVLREKLNDLLQERNIDITE